MQWIADPEPLADALKALLVHHTETSRTPPSQHWAHALEALERATSEGGKTMPKLDAPLDADMAAVLGYVDTWLCTLHALRSSALVLDGTRDRQTLATITTALTAVGQHLAQRLEGSERALIRAHHVAGGSVGELADALGIPRPTAQKRRTRATSGPAGEWERWATGSVKPGEYTPADLRPGWLIATEDEHEHQVQTVSVYSDGVVTIRIGARTARGLPTADGLEFKGRERVSAVPRTVPTVTTTGTTTDPAGRELTVTTYWRAERAPAGAA